MKVSFTLLKYGYRKTNDLDEVLIDMVRYGYLDKSSFQRQISLRNEEIT